MHMSITCSVLLMLYIHASMYHACLHKYYLIYILYNTKFMYEGCLRKCVRVATSHGAREVNLRRLKLVVLCTLSPIASCFWIIACYS